MARGLPELRWWQDGTSHRRRGICDHHPLEHLRGRPRGWSWNQDAAAPTPTWNGLIACFLDRPGARTCILKRS